MRKGELLCEKGVLYLKLLIIRHGDPDYTIDSLTEKGWREAEYLAERMAKTDVLAYYVSPLGRARDTASVTLKKLGRTAEECPWLREFCVPVRRPDAPERPSVAWDWLPQDWLADERFLREDRWHLPEAFQAAEVRKEYDWVAENFDALLARHGYRREGRFYRVQRPNNDTIAFFCHFGLECVLLSHLLNVSPMVLWQGFCAAPTSVTTVVSEERREGIASFRVGAFGDVSHLYRHGEPPAFSGRFCECYGNEGERRD